VQAGADGAQHYECVRYSPGIVDEWNRFVDHCDEAWLYHRSAFVVPNERGWEDKSFALTRNGEIVAICAVAVERKWLGRILVGPGPAVASGPDAEKARRLVLALTEEIAQQTGCLSVRISRSSLAPRFLNARYINSDLAEQGYSHGYRGDALDLEVGAWAIADLRRTPEEILKSFKHGNDRRVKKCERLEIKVVAYGGPTLTEKAWSEFESNLDETVVRTGIEKFPRAHLDRLRSQVENGFALLFSAYEKQECVASVLCQYFKSGAYYQNGGCCERGLALGAMAHVFYTAMIEFKNRGIEYFNVGAYIPCHKGTKSGTISEFKRGLGNLMWDILNCEKILDRKRYWRRILVVGAIRLQVVDWALFGWARSAVKAVAAVLHRR